ncbi:lysylphosphatidylglycerol synthase transmembrane domain-containing protein [Posidoniimonas polymericola]|uniref:lysylphosphatidylglycerol synthase transmembrane domain-containing protein n=1 Tax=Posidoniimonas polymericola TaxID=2528002 RepID=UPI0018D32279|nr:lysylphosphatidylglycerol synthase transmembrane domain-containing protein [Posidoniimonas polymericola]
MVKLLVGGLIIGWLAWHAQQNDKFHELVAGEKRWGMLLLAFLGACFTTALSFLRWRIVALAAGVPLSVGEALRLGSLGFTLNFVSPGSVGGDLFKAAVLARDRPGRRTAAITTVVVDRALALVSLLGFAAFGFLFVRRFGPPLPMDAQVAGWIAVGVAVGAPLVLAVLLAPGVVSPALISRVQRLPLVGGVLSQSLWCWSDYRAGARYLFMALGMCVVGHLVLVSCYYLVAKGLPLESPGWLAHAFMVPFACLSGSIPIFPAGLGAVEGTLDYFYQWFGAGFGNGSFVAFGYRLVTVCVACITAPYYLTHQALVKRTLAEVESQPEAA